MFRNVIIEKAYNKILAHSLKVSGKKIKKGKVLNKEDIDLMKNLGLKEIYVFDNNNNYISENEASKNIAKLIRGKNVKLEKVVNGRADFYSNINGMLKFDFDIITKINFEYEDVAISLLKSESIVKKNQLIGNVKIIPYAIKKNKYDKIINRNLYSNLLSVIKPSIKKISLVLSSNDSDEKQSKKIIKSINARLSKFNLIVDLVLYNKHTKEDILNSLLKLKKINTDLILFYGSTSIVDKNDIFPNSLKKASGKVLAFGAPTDPGNLLMIGTLGNKKVIGVPGCAKSPLRNGFDDILEKICFGIKVDKKTISFMSNGGLYKNFIKKG